MSKKTVLVIDDAQKILDIIMYFLEEDGYTVRIANNPKKGLEEARKGGIDLVLLDIMMPEMDGYEVCRQLNEDSKMRDIPVIMLTARAIILDTPRDFFYGLYGFLSKPFSREGLLRIVGEVFRVTDEPRKTQFIRPVKSGRASKSKKKKTRSTRRKAD